MASASLQGSFDGQVCVEEANKCRYVQLALPSLRPSVRSCPLEVFRVLEEHGEGDDGDVDENPSRNGHVHGHRDDKLGVS